MKNQTLQYFMHDGPSAFRFELAGDLDNDGARRLKQDWHAASMVIGNRALIVDITFVTSVDQEGRELLALWHKQGVRLIAKSKTSRELAEGILGEPVPEFAAGEDAIWARTWQPFHTPASSRASAEHSGSASEIRQSETTAICAS